MASTIKVDKIAQASGTPEFTIPTADGTAGQFIKTDASGVLSFGSVTTTALTGSTNTWIPTITGANALTGTANFTYDGNTLDVKNSGTASSVKLYCESSNAHYQAIKAAPHAGSSDWTLTLPPTAPSVSGQVLSATTAGVASWAGNTPSFRADMSANQAITANTSTKVAFDTERWDTNSAYDPTTNYRFTVPAGEAGKYYFGGFARFDGSGMNNIQWRYLVNNGTTTGSRSSVFTQTLKNTNFEFTGFGVSSFPLIADLDVGDYVEVFIFSASGSSLTVKSSSGSYYQCSSWFGFKLIG